MFASQFKIGKWYTVEAIPGRLMENEVYRFGYLTGWGITPYHVILLFLLIGMIRFEAFEEFNKTIKKIFHHKLLSCSVIGYIILALISSIKSPFFSTSMILAVQQAIIIVMIFSTLHIINTSQQYKRRISTLLAGMITFQSVISIMQFVKQSTIRLGVESYQSAGIGQSPDSPQFFRPLGTYTNANQLGILILTQTTLYLALTWKEKNNFRNFLYFVPILLSCLTILLSNSRTVWSAALIGIIVIVNKYKRTLIAKLKRVEWRSYVAYFSVLSVSVILLISPRLALTINTFYKGAGIETRLELIKEGLYASQFNLWIGTGVGTNEATIIKYFPRGIISIFPTAVHNAYIQILVDSGIFAMILFFMIFLSGFSLKVKKVNNFEGLLVKINLLAIMIYYVFQPHIALLEFPLLGIILGMLIGYS